MDTFARIITMSHPNTEQRVRVNDDTTRRAASYTMNMRPRWTQTIDSRRVVHYANEALSSLAPQKPMNSEQSQTVASSTQQQPKEAHKKTIISLKLPIRKYTCNGNWPTSRKNNFDSVRNRKLNVHLIAAFVSALLTTMAILLEAQETAINIKPSPPTYKQQYYYSSVPNDYRLLKRPIRSLASSKQQQLEQQLNATVAPISFESDQSAASTSGACPPQQQATNDSHYYRPLGGYTQSQVSQFVRPTFYTLRLKVDPTKRKFTAQLMITVEIVALPVAAAATSNPEDSAARSSASSVKLEPPDPTTDDFRQAAGGGHRYLTLHAGSNIHVKRAFYVYTTRGSIQIPASKIGHDTANELLTIDFHPNVITAGQGLLLIVYSGLVNETDSHGLFLHHSLKPASRRAPLATNNNNNNNSNNSSRLPIDDHGLATHMQPGFARRLFPSWDEPHLKARFSLIVVLPFRGYQTLSNMAVHRKSFSLSCSGEPLQEIEFQTTPVMSTYLLTLVIGRFDHLESITANNCRVRVYVYANHTAASNEMSANALSAGSAKPEVQQSAINHRRQAASFALNVAINVLDRLESLLGVKYPLSKFDMIALRDFNSGGMENWGAAIFHENYLLYERSSTAPSQLTADIQVNGGKSRPRWMVVPLVVAHEIVHQWFGNLVTAHSWTYLWLNEGFAQMLMYDLADHLFPDHNYWDMFVEDSRASAMHDDELLSSSHALEQQISPAPSQGASDGSSATVRPLDASENAAASLGQPGAIDQLSLFDEITYNKGALVARIVYHLLGRDRFFSGLKHYLLKHSYDSVQSHDLWLALEEASGLADGQLESLMHGWLRHEGYPLISVTVHDEPAHQRWRLRLAQARFTLLPLDELPLAANRTTSPLADNSDAEFDTDVEVWALPVAVSSELNASPPASELQLANLLRRQPPAATGNRRASSSGFLFANRTATVLLPKSATGSWFKLNFNATGPFRVDYQIGRLNADGSRPAAPIVDVLARMVPAIRDKSMCVIDRLNLADDLFAMVRAGKKPTAYYLRFVAQAYANETETIVLRSIVDSLKRIKAIVSNGDRRLNLLYDSYVQKYLRQVGQTLDRSKAAAVASSAGATPTSPTIGPLGKAVVDTNQQQQQLRLKQNINQLEEIEAFIESSKILFNDTEFHQRAALMFNANFRRSLPSTSGGGGGGTASTATAASNLFDSMDREMRASIYSGALMMGARSVAQADVNDGLPAMATATAAAAAAVPVAGNHNVTAMASNTAAAAAPNSMSISRPNQDPIVGSHSWLSSIFAYQSSSSASTEQSDASKPTTSQLNNAASSPRLQPATIANGEVFETLLKAYETSESSGERFAICSALGLVDEPIKQLKLLNLTLFDSYFRPQDSYHVLESMARTKQGRQLIWDQFKANVKTIERRQQLTNVLKSLTHGGLIEQQQQQQTVGRYSVGSSTSSSKIENHLRHLYYIYSNEYGKVLSLTIELLIINSKWFMRDHDGLVQYLSSDQSTDHWPLSAISGYHSASGHYEPTRSKSVAIHKRDAKWLPQPEALVSPAASSISAAAAAASQSQQQSQVRTVNPGDRVNIPCSLANMGGSIQFAKDDQPIILDSGCAHCQLDISNDGQASLTINRVSSKDQGHWQCWRLDANGKVKQKIPIIQLVITNSPELPILIVNDKELLGGNSLDATITVKENELVNFKCLIKGAASPVDYVHWMLDSSQNVTHLSQLMMEYSPQDNNYLTQSVLKLNATKSMNLKSISCLSNHQLWLTPMTVTAFLNVLYEPSFTISREPGFGIPVSEGMTVILRCEIDSNPSSSPIWIKDADNKTANAANQAIGNGQSVTGKEAIGEPIVLDTQDDGSVMFQPAQRSDSGWYRCKTENKYGNFSSFGYYLNVRPSQQQQQQATSPTTQSAAAAAAQQQQPARYNGPQQQQRQTPSLAAPVDVGGHYQYPNRVMAPNQPPAAALPRTGPISAISNIMNNDQPALAAAMAAGGGQPSSPHMPFNGFHQPATMDTGRQQQQQQCKGSRIDGFPEISLPVTTVNAVLGRQLILPLKFCCNPGPARVFWIHRHLAMIPGRMFGPYITRDIYTTYNSFYCYESTFEIESVKPEDIGTVYVFVSNDKGHAGAQIHIQLAKQNNGDSHQNNPLVGSRYPLANSAAYSNFLHCPQLNRIIIIAAISLLFQLFYSRHLPVVSMQPTATTTSQQRWLTINNR